MHTGYPGPTGTLRLLAAALLTACVAACAGCSTSEDYVDTTIDEARGHAGRRDYARAQELLDSALGHLGEDHNLLFEKAEILYRAHEFGAASEWYERAAASDPRSWKAHSRGWEA